MSLAIVAHAIVCVLFHLVYQTLKGFKPEMIEYKHDSMADRTSMRDITGKHLYGYDRLYRLHTVDYPIYPDQAYGYDPAGNRLTLTVTGQPTQVYEYNTMNELMKVMTGSTICDYSYDAAGNLGSKLEKVGVTTTWEGEYTFDGVNRLTKVVMSTTTVEYGYDADGKRVRETANGKTAWFVFDGLSVVMEMGEDKKPTSVLVPGVSKTRLDLAEPVTEWYLYDGLGSVVMLTDVLGNPTQWYQYDVFGATQGGVKDPFNRYRFVGLQQDDLTGLTYMNARWYESVLGRFIARDKVFGQIRDPQYFNRYAYVGNNPVSYTDESGLGLLSSVLELLIPGNAGQEAEEEFTADQDNSKQDGKGDKQNTSEETNAEKKTRNDTDASNKSQIKGTKPVTSESADYDPSKRPLQSGETCRDCTVPVIGPVDVAIIGSVAIIAGKEAVVYQGAKAGALQAIKKMGLEGEQNRSVEEGVKKATSKEAIKVIKDGNDVVIERTRPGDNGYQKIEKRVGPEGTKSVVQKAYDKSNNLVHEDPKYP